MTTNTLTVRFLLLCSFLAAPLSALAAESSDEILKRADLVRGPEEPFTLKMNVNAYKGKEVINQNSVFVNVYDMSHSLVEFVAPPRDAGRKLLRVDDSMWARIPSSRRSVRITPQQRLIGQASNADVLGTNYATDYSSKLVGEETVATYDNRQANCYKLELIKKTPAASYHRLFYWVEKETFWPIRAEFFAQTGKLIKAAHFMRYGNALGAKRPGRVVIVNAVNKEEFTVLDIVEYGKSTLPASQYAEGALN
jgi:hypothetical protein